VPEPDERLACETLVEILVDVGASIKSGIGFLLSRMLWSRLDAASAGCAERQLEVKPFGSLEVLDDLEEIASLRVAAWTEHTHQALGRPFCSATELLEPNRRVDVIAKYRLTGVEISAPSRRSSFLYLRSDRRRACTVSLNCRVRGIPFLLRLALLVIGPSFVRGRDVAILALLRPAAEQNDDSLAIFTEIDPIPRPEIDAVLEHAGTDTLDVRDVS
jgi:hypothetical protein